ncbi:MAG: chromate efflux transporter [Acidobacteriaceae bacterium]|nr:chromate efflux transporter [Acidobacteriaceae bacterium]
MGSEAKRGSPLEVVRAFLRLGCISFGGPVAHLGYFRTEFVERRHWLDEVTYAELVALCQFLPGPASSQVGFSIGLIRAGFWGGIAAWIGFTLPSALLMLAFARGVDWLAGPAGTRILHALMLVAVAVVAQAVWTLGRRLCPDTQRVTIALTASALVLLVPWPAIQLLAIALGGIAGRLFVVSKTGALADELLSPVPARVAACAATIFGALLLASFAVPGSVLSAFYRAGALVFGGGHVVLPLLEDFVVRPGWVDNLKFLAGYGAAQALPGPLFSFAAYLGFVVRPAPHGLLGGVLALAAIFVPGLLLVLALFPFWSRVRSSPSARSVLAGVNAAVVGLLLAALYRPVWTSAINGPSDVALSMLAFLLLQTWKAPPWMIVLGAAALAAAL